MSIHYGVNGVARNVKSIHYGAGGAVREVKEGWYGVGGVARKFWSSGLTWRQGSMPSSTNWHAMAFGNGMFVAIANDNSAYSADGITWTLARLPVWGMLYDVCYCGSLGFVAVGTNVAVCSVNGITWTSVTVPEGNWCSIAYGDNRIVITGANAKTAYSTNGTSWTVGGTLPEITRSNVRYGNGRFVAVHYPKNVAAWSTNGLSWAKVTLPVPVNTSYTQSPMLYGKDKFAILTNSSNLLYSTDGQTWALGTIPLSGSHDYALTYGDGLYAAMQYSTSNYMTSLDGTTWTKDTLPTSADWCCMTYGNGRFVAAASNGTTLYTE